ncbi:24494_t:CDS:2 [Dentiscutata erythropus]|uniref:24494_t:CDS:1 n=1 Tax=Dentiscutata erythropus TaxID=1348616 RepID=A0A9N9D239_9GLOM|nr:24494_t:CDS:2 [Dentiscutata erythropus]
MTTENIYKQITTPPKMQANAPSDSLLNQPKLYVSELQHSIVEEELKKIFQDVDPVRVEIYRQPGSNAPVNGIVHFSSIENAEKAFAIYNNKKLEAYKSYLKLNIIDPAISGQEPQAEALILQVKHLPLGTSNIIIFNLFRPFGPLFSTRLQYQEHKFKGCAMVQFFKQDDANKAKPANIRTNITNPNLTGAGQQFSPPGNYSTQQSPASPGPEGPIVDPCNLFIKNLDANISSSDLFNHFRRFGRIISARVMRDQETNNSKGFGFVSYTSSEEADRAKSTMHGKTLGTKQIVVRLHEPKKLREAKLANQYNCSPTSPSESRAPSRRNSDYFIINTANEFGQEDLSGLAPKARREVLMSELQKRFKHIPSIPAEEVNPIIEYLLSMKTPEILHILKDATSLSQKITEARHHLMLEKKRRSTEEAPSVTAGINASSNVHNVQALSSNVPQREKFLKAIKKLCSRNPEEVLDLIMTLSQKERSLCYFNADYLTKKILEANQALEAVNCDEDAQASSSKPSINSSVAKSESTQLVDPTTVYARDSARDEIEQFMESIKNKPLLEQKQKLGARLFPKVKEFNLKSAVASKVTISLLDSYDLRDLAHSMNDPEKFKQRVTAASEKIGVSK